MHKLNDLQLAIVIVRLYEGDEGNLKRLLYKEILGCDEEGKCIFYTLKMTVFMLVI